MGYHCVCFYFVHLILRKGDKGPQVLLLNKRTERLESQICINYTKSGSGNDKTDYECTREKPVTLGETPPRTQEDCTGLPETTKGTEDHIVIVGVEHVKKKRSVL